jgi:hypothetical protein
MCKGPGFDPQYHWKRRKSQKKKLEILYADLLEDLYIKIQCFIKEHRDDCVRKLE